MTGLVVFCVTYVLISARRTGWLRVDRPGGALLGAVACVAVGVLTPDEAIASIDVNTLLLLFGMMGMGAYLGADGFFERAGDALAHWAGSPQKLLGAIVWSAGLLAALITNDAVCVLGAPLVVRLVQRHRLPPLPYLLALATAANTGSAATLVGNPQNMLCANLGGLLYREHLLLVGPAALAGLAINHLLVWAPFRDQLGGALKTEEPGPVLTRRSSITLLAIAGAAALYTAGTHLAWTAAAGCA
ncbi:MAG: SLC13 family permease, partial [Polyangiaceae bacterium]|nr:SLC13 family permease [Polyangiaceae bacterium]